MYDTVGIYVRSGISSLQSQRYARIIFSELRDLLHMACVTRQLQRALRTSEMYQGRCVSLKFTKSVCFRSLNI